MWGTRNFANWNDATVKDTHAAPVIRLFALTLIAQTVLPYTSDYVSSFIAKPIFDRSALRGETPRCYAKLKCSEMECSLNKTKQSIDPASGSTLSRAPLDLLCLLGKHDYEIASQQIAPLSVSFCLSAKLFPFSSVQVIEQCLYNKRIPGLSCKLHEIPRVKISPENAVEIDWLLKLQLFIL